MRSQIIALVLVLVAFGALSAIALLDVGYLGILAPHFQSWGGAQVFVDLVILALLACIWMHHDAPKQGLSAWPFIAVTLGFGSFGPLLYLLLRTWRGTQQDKPA